MAMLSGIHSVTLQHYSGRQCAKGTENPHQSLSLVSPAT